MTPVWRSCEFQGVRSSTCSGFSSRDIPDLRRILLWEGFKDHPMRRTTSPDDYSTATARGKVLERARRHRASQRQPMIPAPAPRTYGVPAFHGSAEPVPTGAFGGLLGPQRPSARCLSHGRRAPTAAVIKLETGVRIPASEPREDRREYQYLGSMPYTDRLDFVP